MVLGHGRRRLETEDGELEPWLDWLKRTTRAAEKKLEDLGMEDWVVSYRRKKWKWANRVAHMSAARPANAAATWKPEWDSKKGRRVGHPHARWADSITDFLKMQSITHPWLDAAADDGLWHGLEESYAFNRDQ